MVLANQWLEENYPKKRVCIRKNEAVDQNSGQILLNNRGRKRIKIKALIINSLSLEGILDLSDFVNLEKLQCWDNQLTNLILPNSDKLRRLGCSSNQLTSLDLTNYPNLRELTCWDNQLTELFLSHHNQLKIISVSDNLLTSFNYPVCNPTTLTDLRLNNNNLPVTNLAVFRNLVNLTTLIIGNTDDWIRKSKISGGNQFTGSLSELKNCTKLEWLSIYNTKISADLEYLPNSLNHIGCYGIKLEAELALYGYNLTLWQAAHPHLMIQVGQKKVNLANYQLALKKGIKSPQFLQKEPKLEAKTLNYDQSFNYSNFLVRDPHPFSYQSINNAQSLPLRLYNLANNEVIETTADHKINSYLTLSYCWGQEFENESKSFSQPYQTRLTKLGRKALNKVQATYQFLKQQNSNFPDYIWIDNFCINQANLTEKNREVAQQKEYYSQAIVTLIAIDAEIGNEIDRNDEVEFIKDIITKIAQSPWFHRSWTFQEGLLSKQTIFMFDDALVDGRRLSLAWGGWSSNYNKVPTSFVTPLGWSHHNNFEQNTSLNLGEALHAVHHRTQTVPIDGIYSILGLLPYGDQVTVKYKATDDYSPSELEQAWSELINQAYLYNQKEIITYLGQRNPSNWWLPIIKENGSMQIEGTLSEDDTCHQYHLSQITQVTKQGIQLNGHYTLLADATKIVEIDRYDRENNVGLNKTMQFRLGKKTELITIKETSETYYSEKEESQELFIDMVNHEVILKSENLEKYQALTAKDTLVSQIEQIEQIEQ